MEKGKLKKVILGAAFSGGVVLAQAASMSCGAGKCGAGKCGGNQKPVEECYEQDAEGNCLDKNASKPMKNDTKQNMKMEGKK